MHTGPPVYGPHTNTFTDPWGAFNGLSPITLSIPDPRGPGYPSTDTSDPYVFPCEIVLWPRFRPMALCSKAELQARSQWLERQHRDGWEPAALSKPPLPVRPALPPWSQCVRAWLRQPVRLRKGLRQS